ncbi:MAG TPA: hypothetical protein VGA60_14410 [Kiloniellales bacterium]|jgi:hypothetical protein
MLEEAAAPLGSIQSNIGKSSANFQHDLQDKDKSNTQEANSHKSTFASAMARASRI